VPRPGHPDQPLRRRAAELRQQAGLLRLQSLFLRLQGERLCGHSNDLLTIVMFRRETLVSRPEPPRATLALVS
jgi:hypothetical protein